jgi:hypothetical protein
MEHLSLPSGGDRLLVWRNTIQLFHQYRTPSFVGPFKHLGLSYRVCPEMMTAGGDVRQPDIVASGPSGWVAIEITVDDKSKEAQLSGYADLDPRYLGAIGLHPQKEGADTLSSRITFVDDGPHCQLVYSPTLEATKLDRLRSTQLAEALRKSAGLGLSLLPTIPFTILPESITKGRELRRGIVGSVLQVFGPESPGIRLSEIVDASLERLADRVSVSAKRALIDSTRDHLRVLVSEFLPDHLELTDDLLRKRANVRTHSSTLEHVRSALSRWAGQTPKIPLEKFG